MELIQIFLDLMFNFLKEPSKAIWCRFCKVQILWADQAKQQQEEEQEHEEEAMKQEAANQCQPVHTGVESSQPQRGTRPIKWASILTVTPTFLLLSCQAKCVHISKHANSRPRSLFQARLLYLMTDSIARRLKHHCMEQIAASWQRASWATRVSPGSTQGLTKISLSSH